MSNPNRESGNPADWAYWATLGPNGKTYFSFAPVEGEYAEPQGVAQTMIRQAVQGLSEIVEWVYQVPKKWEAKDIIARFDAYGFKQDEKANHLLKFCLEHGYFEPDEFDDSPPLEKDHERHPKDPDMLLGVYCAKCDGVIPGKIICWNTNLCPTCSDNYEPFVPWEELGMTKEEVMAFKPTEFREDRGKF